MSMCQDNLNMSKLTPIEQEVYRKFIGNVIERKAKSLNEEGDDESNHQTLGSDITNCNGIRPEVQKRH